MEEAKKAASAETKAERRARKRAERAERRAKKEKGSFWKDFKAFISRGNIIDLAVGLVIGAAFTAIVNSVVNDIIKPLIALLVGNNFSELVVVLRPETTKIVEGVEVVTEAITLNYGNLIMAVLTFLIDAIVIFTAVRIVRKVGKRIREGSAALKEKLAKKEEEPAEPAKEAEPAPAPAPVPAPVPAADSENVEKLLAEIRDLLRDGNSGKKTDAAASADGKKTPEQE